MDEADPRAEKLELIPGSPLHRRHVLGTIAHVQMFGLDTSCDWGDCDKPGVTLRKDPEGKGWLSVCQECRLYPDERWEHSYVPLAADVLRVMQEQHVDQATAVLRLGGLP